MKKNMLFVPLFAVLALFAIGFVSASYDNVFSITDVEIDGTELSSIYDTISGFSAGDTVPVRVWFEVEGDEVQEDVEVEVEFKGYDETESVSQDFGYAEPDTNYRSKIFNLEIPNDVDESSEETYLYVTVSSRDGEERVGYEVKLQRDSYEIDVLSVDYSTEVSAGEVFPVSVVVKNSGYGLTEDNFVVVSIPDLGVSTRGYLGDLDSAENYSKDNHEEDSAYRTIYMKVPSNANAGVYDMDVTVYNDDTEYTTSRLIGVGGAASTRVLSAVKTQDISAGETIEYDLILVNSGEDLAVFNLESVSGEFLTVSAPSVVTVGPESSETVSVSVTADSSAPVGTYTFSVDVDGTQTEFAANVTDGEVSASVVALTVVLVVIFVVLLAVLVVLLTRKEKPIEEVETSYY